METALVIWNLLLVMILVLLNGFFVAAEFAMVKVRSTKIDTLLQAGNARAKYAKQIVDNLDAYLSACQLGITLASLGLGWIGEPAIARLLEPTLLELGLPETVIHTISFAVAFATITALHIVLGELAPKSLAIQRSDGVTMWTAVPLIGFYKLMFPAIWVLNNLANWILRLAGIQLAGEHEAAHTEEEIRMLMNQSHQQGYIDQTELTYVDNIFDFAAQHVNAVMIPRTDMICLYAQDSFTVNLEKAILEQLTRYPVCDPDKDHIIGFVHIKDLLAVLAKGEQLALSDIVRQVLAIPETMAVSTLLKLMQKNKAQIAIVIDEYGGTAGLVTIEDLLEEIVGEIQDEFDEERPAVELEEDGSHSVDGRMLLADINELFPLELKAANIETLGGWMASQFELPLAVGQHIERNNYHLVIAEVDNMRVLRVKVIKATPEDHTSG